MIEDITIYLGRLVSSLKLKDGLEMALIAGIIYLVYRSLRGTRGARVVRGFIFLLVASVVGVGLLADYLDMGHLNYLYSSLVKVMVILAVVIFQPELRRSLLRLGQNPLFRLFLKEGASAFVDRIVRSAEVLGRNKIGAIVAIERETRLGGLIEGGVAVDSRLTSELLTTIFWPGSPLHDMGVIIRGGRVAAAGCEFPMPRHAVTDPHLGTRHRAAIGLSEETDAVVIVVSEETGNISVAEGGRLEQNLAPDELKSRLAELLRGEEATLTEHSLEAAETPTLDAKPEKASGTKSP